MNLFKKILVFLLASHTLISSLLMVNIYTVFDSSTFDKQQCLNYLKEHKYQLCYDLVINAKNYCPVNYKE
jgi:hypothetical protein